MVIEYKKDRINSKGRGPRDLQQRHQKQEYPLPQQGVVDTFLVDELKSHIAELKQELTKSRSVVQIPAVLESTTGYSEAEFEIELLKAVDESSSKLRSEYESKIKHLEEKLSRAKEEVQIVSESFESLTKAQERKIKELEANPSKLDSVVIEVGKLRIENDSLSKDNIAIEARNKVLFSEQLTLKHELELLKTKISGQEEVIKSKDLMIETLKNIQVVYKGGEEVISTDPERPQMETTYVDPSVSNKMESFIEVKDVETETEKVNMNDKVSKLKDLLGRK
jgi:chromosome segregation ATPase